MATVPKHARGGIPESLRAELAELWRKTGDENLRRLSAGEQPTGLSPLRSDHDRIAAVSSCLMSAYQRAGHADVFALLVELNRESLLHAVRKKLRGTTRVDAEDVLQDTLMNICRYRSSFRCDNPGAFRKWGQRIAVNTAYRLFNSESRRRSVSFDDEFAGDAEDESVRSPFLAASEAEQAKLVDLAYLTYLNVYLLQYAQTSEKEQRALTLVEIKGATYKETAAQLGIRVQSLKMLIFRARRKILRNVDRNLRMLPSAPQLERGTIASRSPRRTAS